MADKLAEFIFTTGYIGKIRFAPGTLGTLACAVVLYFLPYPSGQVALAVGTTIVGLLITRIAVRMLRSKDPQSFVLDEWAGMSIAVLYLPNELWVLVAGFLLFRFFDVLKPLGIRQIDRWDHPWSIMLDDVLAGVYTNLMLRAAILVVL